MFKMKILCLIFVSFVVISLGFHQTDYSIEFEKYNLISYDKSYVGEVQVKKIFVSRYVKQYSGSVCILKDVDLKYIDERIEARKFQSNEYRLFPFNYTENTCEALMHPLFGDYFSRFNCSFGVGNCYFKKGCYSCSNITYDASSFPPFAPRGKFKLTTYLTYKKTESLGVGEFFVEIKPTNPLERVIGV